MRENNEARSASVGGETELVLREGILLAALESFAQKGFEGTSIRQLNRRLGVSHNLVHHHFGSKLGLWKAVADHAFGSFAEVWAIPHELVERDPEAAWRLCIRRLIERAARAPDAQRLFEQEAALGGERLDYLIENFILPQHEEATKLFGGFVRVAEQGLHLPSVILLITTATTSLFTQASFARQLGCRDPFSQDAIDQHAETVSHILLHGLMGRHEAG